MTDEERARAIVETWSRRSLTDEEGVGLIAAALAAVRAEERERAANVAEEHGGCDIVGVPSPAAVQATEIAASIRAGGKP